MPHPTRRSGVSALAVTFPILFLAGCLQGRSAANQLSPAEAAELARIEEDRGGSAGASVLSKRELSNSAVTRFEQLLAGRIAGVRVVSRGNQFSVRIRNAGGFYGNSEPLYLLDGFPVSGSVLAGLNPIYVERIQVIKDGMAAVYGVMGANGVILVTTIRP